MIIIDFAGFPWNILINILSEYDITSHSEFIDMLFNVLPIPSLDACWSFVHADIVISVLFPIILYLTVTSCCVI